MYLKSKIIVLFVIKIIFFINSKYYFTNLVYNILQIINKNEQLHLTNKIKLIQLLIKTIY